MRWKSMRCPPASAIATEIAIPSRSASAVAVSIILRAPASVRRFAFATYIDSSGQRVSSRRHERHQHVGVMLRTHMERRAATKERFGTVARVVVQERPTAPQLVLEVRESRAGGFREFIIASAHRQRHAIALWNDDARRPELDIERDDLADPQRLRYIVRV